MTEPDEAPAYCPRCGESIAGERFYGPCGDCRQALRERFAAPDEPEPIDCTPAGVSRRRWRRIEARRTVFVEVDEHTTAGDVLDAAGDARRVYMVGRRPWGSSHDLGSWVDVPGATEDGHWLDLDAPVLRWQLDNGRRIEVGRAAAWYGEGAYSAAEAAEAWHRLSVELWATFEQAVPLTTPASTGREAWSRTIPHGVEWPTPSAELAELIRSTSGQGRIQLAPVVDELAELVEVDGRLMYGALAGELPAGPPVWGPGEGDHGPHTRARYRARWKVPPGWAHLGLLGMPSASGGWVWPDEPGDEGEGWIDGVELWLARRWGWPVHVVEHVAWPTRGKPLDSWARRCVRRALDARARGDRLVAAAWRAIVLHGIGAMVGRPAMVTRRAAEPPADRWVTDLRLDGDQWVWTEPSPVPGREDWTHPEWAAAVWARCRVRMLDGPGDTGALHVPRDEVVAIRTDALYLTADPGWPDDGAAGRLRVKRRTPGPMPAPTTAAELLAIGGEV